MEKSVLLNYFESKTPSVDGKDIDSREKCVGAVANK